MLSPRVCYADSFWRVTYSMKGALLVVVAALTLSACGAVGGGAAAPPGGTPSTSPGMGFDLAVTEKSRSATMTVGQKVEVVLHANPGMTTWSGVRSSDPSVLASIVNPAATSVRGVTLAAFQATAPGKAQITAVAGPLCSPGQACPMYAILLTIDITVVAG
jgi:hypothetical protein